MSRRKRIWFIGQCPPPMHGQSIYNERMASGLSQIGALIRLPLGGSTFGKIWRAILNPLLLLVGLRNGDIVYSSLPGQNGIWFFLPTALALRLRRIRFYTHHHSYRAIALGPLPALKLLGSLSDGYATHILLSEKMRDQYQALYRVNSRERFLCLPNAALFSHPTAAVPPRREGAPVAGHLSVITADKGAPYLLELWKDYIAQGGRGKLVLAGPIPDAELRHEVEVAVDRSDGRIRWLGPISGTKKQSFFEEIDLLILPTKLVDEADPLVLLEAYSAGAAVFAPDRGCIRSRLISDQWLMTMDLSSDLPSLHERMKDVVNARNHLPDQMHSHAQRLQNAAEDDAVSFLSEFDVTADEARAILRNMRS
ncbi:glycosyltransferase family 4 protein [Aliiroseovarius sp. KMU-50]|uniref:Glycosyltransferase family 4 protein n=1 Tax=Aliiroseovarius salicola TaxID=3009082 RepID=A0ABT4VXU6_9RHOB|nr:glycosyltransferase family 4 protein [Aliiroseovarius sp. KMU-50]MDA5093075.1 glycosyltransferase family 4 protein [Aliiroseovarius sp. KMU-50]